MKFPYKKLRLSKKSDYFGTTIYKPLINVGVVSESGKVNYMALIDSGADHNIFPAEIGEVIGLTIDEGEKSEFSGIQERAKSVGYFHDIQLIIGGHEIRTKVMFSNEIAKIGHGVLGQRGFFEFFKVVFHYAKEEIELKPRS